MNKYKNYKIGVVIPCYKVDKSIIDVINKIPSFVSKIYVVDDFCPNFSGKIVHLNFKNDKRVKIIFNPLNMGVGGAVVKGYNAAISDNLDLVIKIDGDDQMDINIIELFINPIIFNFADYVKGNRFNEIDDFKKMPYKRIIGNIILSFFTKLSSGYWNILDPTNGYTSISVKILKKINLNKLNKRFFFESDILFRLYIIRAVVVDIPIKAIYKDEISNLKIHKIIIPFIYGNFKNLFKRIIYCYFIRDFSLATLQLFFGSILVLLGIFYSLFCWYISFKSNILTSNGQIMIGTVSFLTGIQMLLGFINYDIYNTPHHSQKLLLTKLPRSE